MKDHKSISTAGFSTIAIAGAWGYIGRKLLDAALRQGLKVFVYDPGPLPADVDAEAFARVADEAAFYGLDADLFHLALHPEARERAQRVLLERASREALLILNEKPMTAPETPEEGLRLVEAVRRSKAVMLYDFPELFDPMTRRIVEFLTRFQKLDIDTMFLDRSKDREDPGIPRNYKRMVPIQYQESVHCLAYALFILAAVRGGLEAALSSGIAARATSEPYCPPNPEAYPCEVDGRCQFELSLGRVCLKGQTDFKRGAPWMKRRILKGVGDGKPFVIEVDYLEGRKRLTIDGQDQGCDPTASSYEAILTTLRQWRNTVSATTLLEGAYPNPRLAWLAYQLSGVLWQSSHENAQVQLENVEALSAFDSGFRSSRDRFCRR